MPVVAAIFALAAATWGAIWARRGSVLVGCGLLLVVSYALGHDFWCAKIGPIPITFDRILLVGLLGTFAYQLRFSGLTLRSLTGSDWILVALLSILIVNCIFSGQPITTDGVNISKWGRLFVSMLLPAVLYGMIRQLEITRKDWSHMLASLVMLGVYLAFTGACEVGHRWSLVFPHYIANPDLGIHFGRARGPELNSVSLGLYLTACLMCGWTLLGVVTRRLYQLALLVALPLMAAGVLFTFTRSTWIGMGASGLIVAAFQIPRRWRMPAFIGGAFVGLIFVTASWGHLLGIKREGTVEDSEHSVGQRQSFAYVSWHMFCDHPIFGVGYGRFYDRKMPYLSDRSQNFELESIRPLHHHNTLLSVLTETGIVGFPAFIGVFIAWIRSAWRLAVNSHSSHWMRAHGILMLALVANYFCSAVFHDLTLLPSEELLLFAFAAVTINLCQCSTPAFAENRFTGRPNRERQLAAPGSAGGLLGTTMITQSKTPDGAGDCRHFQISDCLSDNTTHRRHVNLFGMQISPISMQQAVSTILVWCREPRGQACRYIVTPNADHAVLFQQRGDLRAAYRDASLVLADGTPLVWAARLLGQPLPERVAGSDLVPRLFAAAETPVRVFLLGAASGVADLAARKTIERWPGVQIVGTHSPPIGFENDPAENSRVFAAVSAAEPDLVIVGLGAPKQETWVHLHRGQLQAKVVICGGATIDFLAGHRQRSPVWMRRVGLEWLHRLATEPRRLAGRYARDAWVLPQLVWRQWRRASA
jgi:N-acetylglucosaminyldiphosphoundecaprenol N-acetyl-beta-D-mannosaminyltransferase